MKTHWSSCKKRDFQADSNQTIDFVSQPSDVKVIGCNEVSRLVYQDQFPISAVVRSETMQLYFRRMRSGKITFDSVDEQLEPSYQKIVSKIKSNFAARKSSNIISLGFDKWKASGNVKFIGAYIYFHSKKYCLGLQKVFSEAQVIIGYLNSRLGLFDLRLSDVDILIVDTGSDVQRLAALEKKFTLPCLAHVMNLIAREVVLGLEEDDDNW